MSIKVKAVRGPHGETYVNITDLLFYLHVQVNDPRLREDLKPGVTEITRKLTEFFIDEL